MRTVMVGTCINIWHDQIPHFFLHFWGNGLCNGKGAKSRDGRDAMGRDRKEAVGAGEGVKPN